VSFAADCVTRVTVSHECLTKNKRYLLNIPAVHGSVSNNTIYIQSRLVFVQPDNFLRCNFSLSRSQKEKFDNYRRLVRGRSQEFAKGDKRTKKWVQGTEVPRRVQGQSPGGEGAETHAITGRTRFVLLAQHQSTVGVIYS